MVREPCLPKSHLRVAFSSASPPQILSKFHCVERKPRAVTQLLYKLTHPSPLLHLAHTASPWASLCVLRTHLCFVESEPFNTTLIMVGKFHLKENAERITFQPYTFTGLVFLLPSSLQTWNSNSFFFFHFFLLDGGWLVYSVVVGFVIHWHESAMELHVFPIPIPPPHLPLYPLPLVSTPGLSTCLMHSTWAGDLFHYRKYTCFNAVLSKHPTLNFSHRVQKSVLYICVSFSVLHIGLSLPSF